MRSKCKKNLVEIKEQQIIFKEQINNLVADYKSNIAKIEIATESEQRFRAGFKRGMEKQKEYWHKFFALELQSLETMHNLFLFLDDHSTDFSVVNNQLSFTNDDDAKNFNNFVSNLKEISASLEILHKEYQDKAQETLDKMS